MKILFVTSTYPEDIHTCTSGIFKRMKMFMVALSSLAELDITPAIKQLNQAA